MQKKNSCAFSAKDITMWHQEKLLKEKPVSSLILGHIFYVLVYVIIILKFKNCTNYTTKKITIIKLCKFG